MPFTVDPALVEELVARELAKDRQRQIMEAPRPAPRPESKPLSPRMAMLLGSLADSVSTYTFLKRGTGEEANPMFRFFNGHPNRVIPSAAAGALGYEALYRLIKRKKPKLADTLAGLIGGVHTQFAAENFQDTFAR